LLHAGEEATIAIRIFSPADSPGMAPAPNTFAMGTNIFNPGQVPLSGTWEARYEFSFDAPDAPAAAASYPKPPKRPGLAAARIFNGIINPLTQFAITGVVWYQGESNADAKAYQYRTAFSHLIGGWREHWNQGAFPFYFCQLANHGARLSSPGESAWAELRESQSLTLDLPNTAEAVLIDLGVASDEHPRNKQEVGERLARIALARTYGKTVPFSGPVFGSSQIEGRTIRIAFDHAEGGLVAGKPNGSKTPQPLTGFAVCGLDRKWVWASARIEGGDVVVWSPRVSAPLEVRYGWAENPDCNLYNAAGLPAAPFRTDDFPGLAGRLRY
jgi:sialate O-acetylesterase